MSLNDTVKLAAIEYAVIGPMVYWKGVFETKFRAFNSPSGIHGLAIVKVHSIELLAVAAIRPGTGQFREFVRLLKLSYEQIRFWAVLNETLGRALGRYGFISGVDMNELGEMVDCMDWKRL